MDTIAVISDVHANLEALDAVMAEAKGLEVYCLGDFVDYGANPNEVIALLRQAGAKAIRGNHDEAALTGDRSMFNPKSEIASLWTGKNLTGDSVDYLRSLPLELRPPLEGGGAYFVHASPDDRLWEYVDPRTHSDLFGYYLEKTKVPLIGLGHTHVPYVWRDDAGVVFNPGSVGQPRDGDWRASFALLSFEGSEAVVEIRRVEYDVEKAASRIKAAGLPESHAERLFTGS